MHRVPNSANREQGRPCEMEAIGAFAAEHGLELIEDCAQAIGTRAFGHSAARDRGFDLKIHYPVPIHRQAPYAEARQWSLPEPDHRRPVGKLAE